MNAKGLIINSLIPRPHTELKHCFLLIIFSDVGVWPPNTYVILDHSHGSESPSFDSLNERFYVSDNIPKTFSENSNGIV